jgi:hypothetical protein
MRDQLHSGLMDAAITHFHVRALVRAQPWAVEATISDRIVPQAAVIGIAVNDSLDVLFDTLKSAQKHRNLCVNDWVALVVGWDDNISVQLQGHADQPTGAELGALKSIYFERFPEGRTRERLPDTAYWRIRPTTIRYSDFSVEPADILT